MSHYLPQLTPSMQARIVSFVRAGGYPHVAAEAAGVPRRIFENWLRRGRSRRARPPYRAFVDAVGEAAAQARLRAETTIFDKRPLDWLKCGPARETSRRPGWSAAPKAHTTQRRQDGNALANPQVQRLFARLLDALTPFPEARSALAEKAGEFARTSATGRIVS